MHNKFAAFSGSALAHELGHAANAVGRSKRKQKAMMGLYNLGDTLGSRQMRSLAVALSPKNGTRNAALLGGLTGLPRLIEEGRASSKAIKALRGVGYSAGEMGRAKKTLGGAFGTYGIQAGSRVLEPLIANKIYKGMLKRQSTGKNLSQLATRLKDKVIDPGMATKLRRKLLYSGDTGGRSALGEYVRQTVGSVPSAFAGAGVGKYTMGSFKKGRKFTNLDDALVGKLKKRLGTGDIDVSNAHMDGYVGKDVNLYPSTYKGKNTPAKDSHDARGSVLLSNQH